MNSSETKHLEKTCSICNITKSKNMFVNGRNLCKSCRNKKTREDYSKLKLTDVIEQKCNVCEFIKNISDFHKGRKICTVCTSKKRREKYNTDEEYKKRVIKESINYRKAKNWRDNDLEELKRKIRSNILRYIKNKNKRTMEYLGCSREEYMKWLMSNNNDYTYENHGKEWHIDHVIPLSKFNINDEEEQLIAFNWRNTMPLSCKENLKKNNKIIKSQNEQHYKKLEEYHKENKLELPQVYIDLFAKHLVDGDTLKPSLLLTSGNICEDLG